APGVVRISSRTAGYADLYNHLLAMSTRMRPMKAIAAALLLFGLLGCHTPERGWHAGGLKDDYTVECKHFFLASIYEDHWEDRGPNRYAPHHFKAMVVR